MKLVVTNSAGETVTIIIKPNETFLDLKRRVEEEAGISLDLKDIALKGKKITETQRVTEYFLNNYNDPDEEPPTNVFCVVPGCKNTKVTHPDKAFFEFPSDEIRCHQWVLYCQKLNTGPGKKKLSLGSESTICSDHFRQDQFVKNTNTLLKRTAVPCVIIDPETNLTDNCFEDFDPTRLSEFDNKPHFFQDEDINVDQNVSLCRLCASGSDDFIMIFDEFGRQQKLAEKINLCLPIQVSVTDGLPKQICRFCFNELNKLYDLADTVTLAQNKLVDMADFETTNDDLTLLSWDETGKELVIGSTAHPDEDLTKSKCCPLCVDGTMGVDKITEVKCKIESEETGELSDEDGNVPTVIFCSALSDDTFDLNQGDNKSNCFDESDIFSDSDYEDSLNSKKSVDPLESVKSYDSFYSKYSYDTSDLDSQLGCSPPRDFKRSEPLKLDDGSRSDNDEIHDNYSYPSPLTIMNSEDSSLKHITDNPLSPIDEDNQIESDFFSMGTAESENSNHSPDIEFSSTKHYTTQNSDPVVCRICGSDFAHYDVLEKHSLLHSYPGFYQCCACVKFFSTRGELRRHYDKHKFPEADVFYCDYCSKTFISAFAMATHLCKSEESVGRCPTCFKHYKSMTSLVYHIMNHHDGSVDQTNISDTFFTDDNKLQKHSIYANNARKSHRCKECGKVFKSEASMRYHQRAHQIEEGASPYHCERCGKSFVRKSMLINHLTSAHKYSSFETSCFNCKFCFEAFPTTAAAVSHMDNHHKLECMDERTYSFEMLTITRLFVCEYCERCFAESTLLNSHRSLHNTDDAPYECRACGFSFSSLELLKAHRKTHRDHEMPTEYLADFSIPKTYLCEFCDRCFLDQIKYNEHLTIHFGPEPYQCRHCLLRFSSLTEAMSHRSNHGDSQPIDEFNFYRPYECHYCNKTFAIEDALVKHIRMHTGEKPFICDQCGKGFSQSSGLYTHQKVHSSERPYSCSICPRTFKIKGDRDVHFRKHSGARPYKCEFCGKAFMTQHVYSQHRKIHTGERPYKCDVCGVAFRRSHVLTVHKRIHTGEKPNICDICGKRYRQKGDMLKHKRVQHGIVNTKPNLMSLAF